VNKAGCPICTTDKVALADLRHHERIESCEVHGNWFVTVCDRCGRAVVSDCVNSCRDCYPAGSDYSTP